MSVSGAVGPFQQHIGHILRLVLHQAQQQSQQFLPAARRQRPTMPKSMKAMRLPGR
jgi:hypothetical protein